MKKRLFITLLMALMTPFMMRAQGTVVMMTDTAACESFTWAVNGETYTASTQFTFFRNDTLFGLNLVVNHPAAAYDSVVSGVCYWMFNDTTRYTSGTYHAFYPAGNGQCNREVNLHLTISTQPTRTQEAFSCGEYRWNRMPNDTLRTTGVYGPVTLRDSVMRPDSTWQHCDSLISLSLTVLDPEELHVFDTLEGCDKVDYVITDGYPIQFNQDFDGTNEEFLDANSSIWRYNCQYEVMGYNANDLKNIKKTLVGRGNSAERCFNKTVHLKITVKHSTKETLTVKACDMYEFYGSYTTYKTVKDSVHRDTTWAEDSTFTVDVTEFTHIDTILVEYGDTYTHSVANKAFCRGVNEVGCGDTIILNLTINPSPAVYVEGDINLRPDNQGTTLFGASDQQNMKYQWFAANGTSLGNKDSLVISHLDANTDYKIVGVNSKTTCSDTNFFTVTVNEGIGDVEGASVKLYPNPATDRVLVECDEAVRNVTLYNTLGQRVLVSESALLNVRALANGTYAVRIETESGRVIVRSLVVTR